MAVTDWTLRAPIPDPVAFPGVNQGTITLDANGEVCALVFRTHRAFTARYLHFRTSTVTLGGNGLTVGIQGVDASGNPDGAWGISANQAILNGDDNKWFRVDLGAGGYALSAGPDNLYAIALTPYDYSTQNMQIVTCANGMSAGQQTQYGDSYAAAAWTKAAGQQPAFALEDAAGDFLELGLGSLTATSFMSTSTPDEYGNVMTLPFWVRAIGIWVVVDSDADFTLSLYGSSTVAATITKEYARANNLDRLQYHYFDAGTTLELPANTAFRVTIAPAAASNIEIQLIDVNTNMLKGFPLKGNMQQTSRVNAGAWTDSAVGIVSIGIIVDGQRTPVFPTNAQAINTLLTWGFNGEYGPGTVVPPSAASSKKVSRFVAPIDIRRSWHQ